MRYSHFSKVNGGLTRAYDAYVRAIDDGRRYSDQVVRTWYDGQLSGGGVTVATTPPAEVAAPTSPAEAGGIISAVSALALGGAATLGETSFHQ